MKKDKQNRPHRLTPSEQKHPRRVIKHFFHAFHLEDIHQELHDWYAAALSSNSADCTDGEKHSELLFFYEETEKLIEAAYCLQTNKPKKKQLKRKTAENRALEKAGKQWQKDQEAVRMKFG